MRWATGRTGRRVLPAALALGLTAAALAACGSQDDAPAAAPGDDEVEQDMAEASTDLAILRQILTFPGEPEVWWTQIALGVADERTPGPTDLLTTAVLDYGDPAAVADLFEGVDPTPDRITARPWFPDDLEAVARDGAVALDRYTGVPAFGDGRQRVAVAADAPGYVIITFTTT